MKTSLQVIALMLAGAGAAPSTASCKVSPRVVDNFDDPKYGVVGLSDLNFLGPPPQGTYITYTKSQVATVTNVDNLPPPSGTRFLGSFSGGLSPNPGFDGFRLFKWKYACTTRTVVQGVNVIPSCKITITCNELVSGDAIRQSFNFAPDSALGLTGKFLLGNFNTDFQTRNLAGCSVSIDEASKQVSGVNVPLDSNLVVALFDDIETGGVKCS